MYSSKEISSRGISTRDIISRKKHPHRDWKRLALGASPQEASIKEASAP
jgi:hypothetical protein